MSFPIGGQLERNLYLVTLLSYRIISMILSDLWPGFHGCTFEIKYVKNGATLSHSYYSTSIGSRMRSIEWCHIQWPWMIPNPDFKDKVLFKGEYYSNRRILYCPIADNLFSLHLFSIMSHWCMRSLGDSWASCFMLNTVTGQESFVNWLFQLKEWYYQHAEVFSDSNVNCSNIAKSEATTGTVWRMGVKQKVGKH